MKKIVALLCLFWLTSFTVPVDTVYICNSKYAAKYHYSDTCRGLNACKHEIIKITLKAAKDKGFALCGFED